MLPRPARSCSALALGLLSLLGAQEASRPLVGGPAQPHVGELPLGLARALPEPEDNAFDRARWELGRRLFFDPVLSADRSVACASCHKPEHGFADDQALSRGVGGARTLRNAPSLQNRGFGESFMWDGRVGTLEEQVLMPIENEREMALALDEALARLAREGDWAAAFGAAFDDGLTRDNLARALAQYVRRLVLGDSAIDRFRAGEFDALDSEERVGLWVFESKGRCWRCHAGPNFSDERFHATGVGAVDGRAEEGRLAVTGDEADRGGFKTPTLRGVAHTAPYMHDGSLATLEEVVEFYRRGGNPVERGDPLLEPLELTDREAAGLAAFLRALSRAGDAARPRGAEDAR